MPATPPSDPLPEASFFVLLCLTAGPRHGYAVLKDIEALSQGQVALSVSTLYTTLSRLQEQGLIERSDDGAGEARPGLPRKVYRLTGRGEGALSAEAHRLQALLAAYQRRLGAENR